MDKLVKIYHIICEGSSEVAYLQELNKYMREKQINVYLKPVNAGSGDYKTIEKEYKKTKRNNRKDEIHIWIDKDIYIRENKQKNKYASKANSMPDFKFNFLNFEDFLVMHCDDHKVDLWNKICSKQNHFKIPMRGSKVVQDIQPIFSQYYKGFLPEDFILSDEKFNELFKNQANTKLGFKSNFVDFIKMLLENEKDET